MKKHIRRMCACLLVLFMLFLCACIDSPPDIDLKTRNLTWAVGAQLPSAGAYVVDLPEGYTVRLDQPPVFSSPGQYDLSLIVTDPKGKEINLHATLSLVIDQTPPAILGAGDISAYLGEGIAYRAGVSVSDNCHNAVELTVDHSQVDPSREGIYPVHYTAVDAAGNKTVQTVQLYLYERRVGEDELYAMLDPIIERYIPTAGSLEMQVRAVYQYVYNNIGYSATSDKSNWIRAAYDGLRTGNGDCFTYFALSKAFFERLGIANMDVTRTPGIVPERHYWNYVNIGTVEVPRWYHFDATRLQGGTISTCLLTNAQVAAYTADRAYDDGTKGYFYAYDSAGLPEGCDTVITPTPSIGY